MKEIWKDVPNYEGIYKCSNLGRIMSVERVIEEKTGKKRISKQIIRKSTLNKNGYLYITMTKTNEVKLCTVHRIVALTFLTPIEGKNIVNHKNGIKTDNNIKNLEWCNKSENELHAYRVLGKINIKKGSVNLKKRKRVNQYDLNNVFIASFDSIRIASIETNTNRQKISAVCLGKRKQTNGFIFKHEIIFL